jgi:hypothetical protein
MTSGRIRRRWDYCRSSLLRCLLEIQSLGCWMLTVFDITSAMEYALGFSKAFQSQRQLAWSDPSQEPHLQCLLSDTSGVHSRSDGILSAEERTATAMKALERCLETSLRDARHPDVSPCASTFRYCHHRRDWSASSARARWVTQYDKMDYQERPQEIGRGRHEVRVFRSRRFQILVHALPASHKMISNLLVSTISYQSPNLPRRIIEKKAIHGISIKRAPTIHLSRWLCDHMMVR